MSTINQIYNFFLDIFYPKRCIGCGKFGSFLCYNCAKDIKVLKTSVCPNCGKITKYNQYCSACKSKNKLKISGLYIAAVYDEGPIKELIHHFKYSGLLEISPILGELLCQKYLQNKLPNGDLIVVPVPLHKKREKQRGFNQAEVLARYFSEQLSLKGGLALERIINTQTQINLAKKDRIKNLINAFVCVDQELIKNKTVILIDDVTTTGTTLNECAKVLREAGAKKVYGLVVAKRL